MTEFSSSTFDRYSGKWLIGTGVFELVLASIFLFFGATDEFLLFPFGPADRRPRPSGSRARARPAPPP